MITDEPSKNKIMALVSLSAGALDRNEAAAILQNYDKNLHEATAAVLDRLYVSLPIRSQPQISLQIENERNEQELIESMIHRGQSCLMKLLLAASSRAGGQSAVSILERRRGRKWRWRQVQLDH